MQVSWWDDGGDCGEFLCTVKRPIATVLTMKRVLDLHFRPQGGGLAMSSEI